MTFRDDHDAALARAEALDRELASARERSAKTEAELASSEAHREELEAKLEQYRTREQTTAATDTSGEAPRSSGNAWVLPILALGAVVMLGALATKETRSDGIESAPNPDCTLQTDPPGAQIVIIRRDRMTEELMRDLGSAAHVPGAGTYEMRYGTAPITKPRLEWLMDNVIGESQFEARLDGYHPLPVSIPLEGMGCSTTVYKLIKK